MVSGQFEGRIRRFVWTRDSKGFLFGEQQGMQSNLFGVDASSRRVTKLTSQTGTLTPLSFSRDRKRMVYSLEDAVTPPDLFTSSTSEYERVRLTEANPGMSGGLRLARAEVTRWKSRDGLEIEGILHLPEGYRQGTRLPLILHLHGGPAGAFTNSFDSRYHIYAGLGYISLSPNVRGSSGYSDDFLRHNMYDIGGGDYQDLMAGVDHVIAAGYADPERMGIRGWSYGGILGGWTITQTNRFKAASLGAMVADWTSEYGPGFNHDVHLWYIGETPWEKPEEWRLRSPLTHVKNVTTPTILFHGIRDVIDTEPQSMMFYMALRDQNKPVRYLRFPREPHGFKEPRHQRTVYVEEVRWIQKYVRGVEWTPWERLGEKAVEEKDVSENPLRRAVNPG